MRMDLLKIVVKSLDDLLASDIKIFDMKGYSPLFDYMVLATADNERKSNAMVKRVREEALENGYDIKGIEGKDGSWILVDCKDIIVNIFNAENRDYYGFDRLYGEVKNIDVKDIL